MSSKTLFYSVLVHAAVAGALLLAAERKQAHRNISIAVVDEKKPKAKEEKKAPPKPIVAPPVVHRAPPAAPKASAPSPVAPESAPAPKSAPAPIDTGLTLGDADGPGIDIGGPARTPAPQKPKGQDAPSVAPKKIAPVVHRPDEKVEEECHEDPTKPEPLTRPEIEYTTAARAAGIEGRLVLRLTVAADGTVAKSDVVSPVDPALDAAALATVERWRFRPSMRCGKPIFGGVYTLARRFELGD